jgi:hypothetical protein
MFFAVPPTVILVPTVLAFVVQIAAAAIGLGAVIAMVVNRFIEVCFCFFNSVLALGVVIGAGLGRRCNEQPQRSCCHCCYCCLSYFVHQGFLLRFFVFSVPAAAAAAGSRISFTAYDIAPFWGLAQNLRIW